MSMIPAIIKSYDADSRTVRISIPGLTDNAEVLPRAELLYTMGDAYNWTECQIDADDPVWIDFIAGDPRRPIVTGYRALGEGNANGWRKFRHENIELIAAQVMNLIAGSEIQLTVGGTAVTLVDGTATIAATTTHVTGALIVDKLLTFNGGMAGKAGDGGGAAMQIDGGAEFTDDVVAAGTSVHGHEHTTNAIGAPTTPPI